MTCLCEHPYYGTFAGEVIELLYTDSSPFYPTEIVPVRYCSCDAAFYYVLVVIFCVVISFFVTTLTIVAITWKVEWTFRKGVSVGTLLVCLHGIHAHSYLPWIYPIPVMLFVCASMCALFVFLTTPRTPPRPS